MLLQWTSDTIYLNAIPCSVYNKSIWTFILHLGSLMMYFSIKLTVGTSSMLYHLCMFYFFCIIYRGLMPWSNDSWIYNYICNKCISPLMLQVRIPIRIRSVSLCDIKFISDLWTGRWFSSGTSVSYINKTGRQDITAILFNVVLITINQNSQPISLNSEYYCLCVQNVMHANFLNT